MHSKPFRYSPLAGATVLGRVLLLIFLVFLVVPHPALWRGDQLGGGFD